MNPKQPELSQAAGTVWSTLTDKEKEVIQKDYPLLADRNDLLRGLAARGVRYGVLVEISGVSLQHIQRICSKKKRRENSLPSMELLESKLKEIISSIRSYTE